VSRTLGQLYWNIALERREIVIRNLLPLLNGDRAAADKVGRCLLRNFAAKLADLWRYESGGSIDGMFGELTGWEHFTTAQATRRGVLLLTPHLGNWEFGAPLLAQRGVPLLVITLAEPHGRLTELRQASRARWGIETLVMGRDPFAFVELIRRLESGAIVALLVDRPPEASAVMVELLGRKFAASIAAAELARASGCVLLPVYLPRTAEGYAAHILPEIPYDRPALRSRESRNKLTQEILRAFEPAIRQHLDQWYHFIPVWP
jgi:KDO2-lipid IV(A) lauroyltransferase